MRVRPAVRVWSGGLAAATGLVCWALSLTFFEPGVHASADRISALTWTSEHRQPGADEVAQMMLWAKDLRWAAMVLAIGGLLIAVAARAVVLLAAPFWLWLDIYLDRANIGGWQAFSALVAGVGLIFGAVLWASRRDTREQSGRGILVYCGVASALAPMMLYADPMTKPYRPAGMMAVAIIVSLGLALSAVRAALTAVPVDVARRRLPRGLAFALAVIVPTIATLWWLADRQVPTIETMVASWAVAPILLLGCVLLVTGRPSTALTWAGQGLLATVVIGVSIALTWIGVIVGYMLQYKIVPFLGHRAHYDAYQYAITGLVAGPIIGALAALVSMRSRPPIDKLARQGS